ncbi:MAG: hypothetical protein WB760_09640 [Xanthobacteraceae bacterium]
MKNAKVDGLVRLISTIKSYIDKHPTSKADLPSLFGSPEFEQEILLKCEAPKFFQSRTEFKEALTIAQSVVTSLQN